MNCQMSKSRKSKVYRPCGRFILFGCICLTTWTCEDFFEKDLSQKEVQLLVPADNAVATAGEQMFLWEGLKGASAYRLRVVSPDFSCPAVCWADTLVTDCRFGLNLPSGKYAWGVRAENSAWKSGFCSYKFTVETKDTEQ